MAEKKHKWIAAATEEHRGAFREAAQRAGKTTRQYAEEMKDSPGTVGKRARLALVLMGMHHGHAPENTRHTEEKSEKKTSRERREARYGKKE